MAGVLLAFLAARAMKMYDHPFVISSTAIKRPITKRPDSGQWVRIIPPKIIEITPPTNGTNQLPIPRICKAMTTRTMPMQMSAAPSTHVRSILAAKGFLNDKNTCNYIKSSDQNVVYDAFPSQTF